MGKNRDSNLVYSGSLLKGRIKLKPHLCCRQNLGVFTHIINIQSYWRQGSIIFFLKTQLFPCWQFSQRSYKWHKHDG